MKVEKINEEPIKTVEGRNIAEKESQGSADDMARKAKTEDTDKTTVGAINTDMRKFIISSNMVDLLNNQLQDEIMNHNLYRTFALFFRSKGLFKLEEYYNLRAKEELEHHDWIYGYLSYCGIPLQYPGVQPINIDGIKDEVEIFSMTVDREIETTAHVNEIYKTAMREGDFGTIAWLMGNSTVKGNLIPEQTEEMSISNDVLRIAKQDADWISKADSILEYYKKTRP